MPSLLPVDDSKMSSSSSPQKKKSKGTGGSFARDHRLHRDGGRHPAVPRRDESSSSQRRKDPPPPGSPPALLSPLPENQVVIPPPPPPARQRNPLAIPRPPPKSSPIVFGDDSPEFDPEVEVIAPPNGRKPVLVGNRDPITDEVYTPAVRARMCQILERRPSENNPQTYTQGFFRQNIALPLIERKGYLCTKAGLVDRAEKQGAAFEQTLQNYILDKGGGRVQGEVEGERE